jgi:Dolichyl-phosphate-mannose-protein mannosyltransferase
VLNRFLLLGCTLLAALCLFAIPVAEGAPALALAGVMSGIAILLFRKYTPEKEFITTVFLSGLVLRMGFGLLIHIFELRAFFGGDALAYDVRGWSQVEVWLGTNTETATMILHSNPESGAGYGMYYLTAAIYMIFGRNILAAQSFCAVIGAATAPMIYHCARKIFGNLKVARFSALSIAIFPSFVIWSGQLLKDGLIIFMLVASMTMVLQLQDKLNYAAIAFLIFSMIGILSLRFYIFYMVFIAVVGSFVVGVSKSNQSIFRRTVILFIIGFGLMYLGVGRTAEVELRVFGNLERIQSSRSDLARAAGSGFNEETDVSTSEGALTAVPTGFMYLMLAPFPWQAENLRQSITIPEVLAWWAMIPFGLFGLAYTIRYKLRNAFPVLIFSLLLSVAYSVLQGNVGTAYRQRTQIQVFLFIMIAVGWTVYQERKENKRLLRQAAQRKIDHQLRTGAGLANR